MSLIYNCWFASPPPDLYQVLDQVADEYIEETASAIKDHKWLFFYQSDYGGKFFLYYNERDELNQEEDTILLDINPAATVYVRKQQLPVGELDVRHCWHMTMGKGNIDKANEAYARLLRTVLQHYTGDFATLADSGYLYLCRLGGQVYLNRSSGLASEPLLSLLDLSPDYQVGDYLPI
jgi:hypothetical protein